MAPLKLVNRWLKNMAVSVYVVDCSSITELFSLKITDGENRGEQGGLVTRMISNQNTMPYGFSYMAC